MPVQVVNGAVLQCSFGLAPGSLVVLPASRVLVGGQPAANVADCLPLLNVLPFGMCNSLANPLVAAATTAALGVLTPMPCVPAPVGSWTPVAPTTLVGGKPALVQGAQAVCAYGGVIQVVNPGQVSTLTS